MDPKRGLLFRTNNIDDPDSDGRMDSLCNHLEGLGWSVESYKDCRVEDIDTAIRGLGEDPPDEYSKILIYVEDHQQYSEIEGQMVGLYTSYDGEGETEILKIKSLAQFLGSDIDYDELIWVDVGPRSGISVAHCLGAIAESAMIIASRDQNDDGTRDGFNLMNSLEGEDFRDASMSERERLEGSQSVQIEDKGTVL